MFLKNERGLGVRNGTLGKVEQVSPERMAVKLDDGRSVAFDLKDYAHVDHGYAATIHKSQGVTVDRAHRSEEHTSELQSLMRSSYDAFCLNKTNKNYTRA